MKKFLCIVFVATLFAGCANEARRTAGVDVNSAYERVVVGESARTEIIDVNYAHNNSAVIAELTSPDFTAKFDNSLNAAQDLLAATSADEVSVPVTDNIVLVLSNKTAVEELDWLSPNGKGPSYKTAQAELNLIDKGGLALISLKTVGKFSYDGTTATPIQVFGVYTALLWDVSTSDFMSNAGPSSYVTTQFTGAIKIGVDPVDMTFITFSRVGEITCDAEGRCKTTWYYAG